MDATITTIRNATLTYIGDLAKYYNQDYINNTTKFKDAVADLVKIHDFLDPIIEKYKKLNEEK